MPPFLTLFLCIHHTIALFYGVFVYNTNYVVDIPLIAKQWLSTTIDEQESTMYYQSLFNDNK